MKNSKKFLIALLAIVLPMSFFVKPTIAQEDEVAPISENNLETESTVTYEELDMDLDMDWDDLFESMDSNSLEEKLEMGDNKAATAFMTLFAGAMLIPLIILGFAQYIYFALTLQKTAEKLGMNNTWYAWIPVLNSILLFKMGDQDPYLLLLLLVPVIGAFAISILTIIATMKVCEKRGHDKMIGLLVLIPLAGLILWGVLAWGEDKKAIEKTK